MPLPEGAGAEGGGEGAVGGNYRLDSLHRFDYFAEGEVIPPSLEEGGLGMCQFDALRVEFALTKGSLLEGAGAEGD